MAIDLNKVREFYEKLQGSTTSFWVPKPGTNLIRILPVDSGDGLFFKEVLVHFVPGSTPFVCLKYVSPDNVCPACQYVDELRRSENAADIELARRLSAKRRFLMCIVDLDDTEAGVQIFSCGAEVLKQILAYFADPDWGDITDPDKGYDIIIEKTGVGLRTTYTVRARKTPTPLPDKSLLNRLPSLDKALPIYDESTIKQILENYKSKTPQSITDQVSSQAKESASKVDIDPSEELKRLNKLMGGEA